ncbi:MAG: hypothetical protein PVH50_11150 [Anaerolineae bacterium]|jgi:hypothetical protein
MPKLNHLIVLVVLLVAVLSAFLAVAARRQNSATTGRFGQRPHPPSSISLPLRVAQYSALDCLRAHSLARCLCSTLDQAL